MRVAALAARAGSKTVIVTRVQATSRVCSPARDPDLLFHYDEHQKGLGKASRRQRKGTRGGEERKGDGIARMTARSSRCIGRVDQMTMGCRHIRTCAIRSASEHVALQLQLCASIMTMRAHTFEHRRTSAHLRTTDLFNVRGHQRHRIHASTHPLTHRVRLVPRVPQRVHTAVGVPRSRRMLG